MLETANGAVVRRVHAGLRALGAADLELAVVEAGGLRRATAYRLSVPAGEGGVLARLGVLDAGGRPRHDVPAVLTRRACDRTAYVRGALLGRDEAAGFGLGAGVLRRLNARHAVGLAVRGQQLSRSESGRYLGAALQWRWNVGAAN